MLYRLVPSDIVHGFQHGIYELVCKLAKIAKGADGQLSTKSRERCVGKIDPAFWELYLRHGFEWPSFMTLYLWFAPLHPKAYDPSRNWPISSQSLPTFMRLVQESPTSAAFSFLTMYSIRHRTLTDHPNAFDFLFEGLSDSERLSNGIGKLTIPLPSPLQLIKHSQGTNSYQTYSQQQNPSSIPSGTNRKTSRMTGRLENVSKRFGPMLMSPILFARRTRLLLSMSLLECCIA